MLSSAPVTVITKTSTILLIKENPWLIDEGKNVVIEKNKRSVRKSTS